MLGVTLVSFRAELEGLFLLKWDQMVRICL
jgi:hypothetical protein